MAGSGWRRGRPLPERLALVVIGVSGSGKTTVGTALAERLAVPFLDADDLHSPESIAKMRSGVPLDDADRWPWLDRAGAWLAEHDDTGAVLACSALRRAYRDRLVGAAPRTWFVQLTVERAVLADRVASRQHPFMPGSLLDSQLVIFEPLAPEEPGVAIAADQPVARIVEAVLAPHQ